MKKLPAAPLALACALALAGCGSAPGAAPAEPEEAHYSFLLAGNPAGTAVARTEADGSLRYDFEFNDRGRGLKTTTRIALDGRGLPRFLETTGHDYFKGPVEERFERADGRAVWRNASESGESGKERAFYLSLNGSPQEVGLLARALLGAGGRLGLLPEGEARIERVASRQVSAGGITRSIHLHAISGLGFEPVWVWLDDRSELFAQLSGWASLIRQGWEGSAEELTAAQKEAESARGRELAERLARRPERPVAIAGARLFDPRTGTTLPGTTVVVSSDRILAVGRDGEVEVPRGAEVVQARGRALLPGLWDLHTHVSALDGLLHLAAGVTAVRDLANDVDELAELERRWDSGELLGPRVFKAGFIDGPGPYAGPTKVLVDTEEEAVAAVDRYAELGYGQIKVYSSLDPALVPAILERAKRHGLRVSGHIPFGMTAEEAVRAGFDEIQHANFLVLNFLEGVDTRTPARFTEVAAKGAELDLGSERVRSFIALLAEKKTVVDPTVAVFEGMLTARPGQVSPGYAAVAGRFPAQLQRSMRAGGLPVPEGLDQRYRDSFGTLLGFVRDLHRAGVPLVAGTDALAGFSLHRELELYVAAGIPAPDVLRIATLGAAEVLGRQGDLGTVEPGKLADLILVDGDPAAEISDLRRVALTLKGGVLYEPDRLYEALGVRPAG
jgi:imidazolonepropionase-like amidohydrolase